MAQAPSTSTSQSLLWCGECREVLRSPRLLPQCSHTFCLHCLHHIARAHGHTFPCPTCQTVVSVPDGGVDQFKVNVYISEADLERERKQTSQHMCKIHRTEKLTEYCRQCDEAICSTCRLEDKHKTHHFENLCVTSQHCKERLKASNKRLGKSVKRLAKASVRTQNNKKAAKKKSDFLKKMINEQYESILGLVTTQRDKALQDLEDLTQTIDTDHSNHFSTVQQHLNALVHLQQRVSQAIDSENDAEAVVVEKEVKEGEGSIQELRRVIGNIGNLSRKTQRPYLQRDLQVMGKQNLAGLFGTPACLHMFSVRPEDAEVTPVYKCPEINGCQEVHAIQQLYDSIIIAYGGAAPAYENERVIKINLTDSETQSEILVKRKVSFKGDARYVNDLSACIADEKIIHSKAESKASIDLQNHPLNTVSKIPGQTGKENSKKGGETRKENSKEVDFDLEETSEPFALDANPLQDIFILLSADNSHVSKDNTSATTSQNVGSDMYQKRIVQMYVLNQSKPVSRYTPPQQPFFPTDVCFWHGENNPVLLLISDMATDSVHIVSVANHQFRFLKYLANGSPHIMRPTALDCFESTVWIGCENGRVLRCRSTASVSDSDAESDEDGEDAGGSDDGSHHLHVEIASGFGSESVASSM